MTSPVQLSDLDLAVSADDADLALIRKNNTTDYKVTVQLLRNINVSGLPNLSPTSNSPLATDLLILARAGVNSKCTFAAIGLPKGTKLWFYQDAVPVSSTYWKIVPNTGDRLLAVKGGGSYTTGGTTTATSNWQQPDWTLTLDQIPAHTHSFTIYTSDEKGNLAQNKCGSTNRNSKNTQTTDSKGGGQPHNHGNTWRPAGAVGIICEKQL